ncbi:LPD7 domain-containing protein [Hafnia paralvei]|uniref:LPD7 domain-containing protein n=1 Tax=Hafnia paralvei TaxID=546367 RepID=UPI0024A7DEC3|nr:LPD7 domain-containing protein [Hafnia paralvei]
MLIRVRGYNSGFAEYLRTGMKAGNKLHRDELDKRVSLYGDLDITNDIINAMPDTGDDRYLHFTLGFKEDHFSDEMLKEIFDTFIKKLMNAYHEEEYAVYAEAHLPKIKSIQNESTGQPTERKPHIHIIIPKVNLIDGSYLNPVGYYQHNERYIEAIQEQINSIFSLESPRDNRRVDLTDVSDFISRYKGDVFKTDSKKIKETLLEKIYSEQEFSHKDFVEVIKSMGKVTRRNGRSFDYYNLKPFDAAKGINLKEYIFSEQFLDMSRADKLDYFFSKYSIRTDEQKRIDDNMDSLLVSEWLDYRSYEIKYMHPGSKEFKEYKSLEKVMKKNYLSKLINNSLIEINSLRNDKRLSSVSNEIASKLKGKYNVRRERNDKESSICGNDGKRSIQKNTRQRSDLFRDPLWKLQFSDVDSTFYKQASVFLQTDTYSSLDRIRLEFPDTVRYPIDRVDDRPRRGGQDLTDYTILSTISSCSKIDVRPVSVKDNCVESILSKLDDAKLSLAEMNTEKWKLVHQRIDALLLLRSLAFTHGVLQEKYTIAKSKNGYDRIKSGKRTYSINDFLTKELHMNWSEASKYIIDEYERQRLNGDLSQSVIPSLDYWAEFKQWSQIPENSYKTMWQILRCSQNESRAVFRREFREEARRVWKMALTPHKRIEMLAELKLKKISAKEALEEKLRHEKNEYRIKMRTSMRYKEFLASKVAQGDKNALSELRRQTLRIKKSSQDNSYIQTTDSSITTLLNDVTFKVKLNGTVTYYIDSKSVVEDTKEWVSVLHKDDPQAIILALKIALEKNGQQPLVLIGGDEFKENVIKVAIEHNLFVRFSDVELQLTYEGLANLGSDKSNYSRYHNRNG